jgi:Tfp pilus assembly protein PilX
MDVFSTRYSRQWDFWQHSRKFKCEVYTQSGFILVTVLFFLLVIALIVLDLLNTTYLQLRMSQNYAVASQQFWAAEAGLKMAEAQLASVWEEKHLRDVFNYADYQVQYEVERFSLPFCHAKHIVYYYRITAKAKQAQQRALVLQTTYAKKTHKKCIEDNEKRLIEGRSSWRELNKY